MENRCKNCQLCFYDDDFNQDAGICKYCSEDPPEKVNINEETLSLIEDKNTTKLCYIIALYLLNLYHFITLSDTKEIYVYRKGVYSSRGEEIISSEIQNILKSHCKIHLVNEILGHIRRTTIKNRSEIKEHSTMICLENGILNLNTLEVTSHTPDIIFFNKLPISYKENADCPKIKKFLGEVVKKDDIILLQEFVGYCLLKGYPIQKALIIVGIGANGKSVFLILLKKFLGSENICAIPLHILENNRFTLSSLFGKFANIFADLPSKALTSTSIFKMLLGGDLIYAEKKFKDQFFFVNYSKQIFSANQVPKSPEDTDAFFRRWIIVTFPNQFLNDKDDKDLVNKLTTDDELSGFLNFAIDGLKRLLTQGDFSNTKSITEVRDQYIRMSDSVGAFIMDFILISPDNSIPKKELYTLYCDYCRTQEYPILAENIFHKDLQKKIRVEDYRPLINIYGKKERIQCWKGIKFDFIKFKCENNSDKHDNVDVIKDNKGNNCVNQVKDVKVKTQLKSENGVRKHDN